MVLALPGGVRPRVGDGHPGLVLADEARRGRRAAPAAAHVVPRRDRPRAVRPPRRTASRPRDAHPAAVPRGVRQPVPVPRGPVAHRRDRHRGPQLPQGPVLRRRVRPGLLGHRPRGLGQRRWSWNRSGRWPRPTTSPSARKPSGWWRSWPRTRRPATSNSRARSPSRPWSVPGLELDDVAGRVRDVAPGDVSAIRRS